MVLLIGFEAVFVYHRQLRVLALFIVSRVFFQFPTFDGYVICLVLYFLALSPFINSPLRTPIVGLIFGTTSGAEEL